MLVARFPEMDLRINGSREQQASLRLHGFPGRSVDGRGDPLDAAIAAGNIALDDRGVRLDDAAVTDEEGKQVARKR